MAERIVSKQATRQVLKDYFQQYRTHPWYALIGFLMPAIGTILIFFIPPLIIASIIDRFVADGNITLSSVSGYIFVFAGLWLLGEICWRIGRHFMIKLESAGINSLANTVFSRLLSRDYDFFVNNFVGSVTKKSIAFSRNFELFTDIIQFNVFANIFPIIFALIVLWTYSFWLPLALLGWTVIAFSIGLPIVKKRSRLVAERHDASSKLTGRLSDSITNMPAIKSFAAEAREQQEYGKYAEDWMEKYKRANDYHNQKFEIVMSPIYVATNVTGLIVVILVVQQLSLTAGVIVVVYAYFAQVSQIFWQMSRVYRMFESAITEAGEFTELTIKSPLITDVRGAKKLVVKKGEIEFKDVSFRYLDAKKEEGSFLEGFNLKIKNNEKVGLVGPSGGGKTTITKLLLRFADVQSGQILIDGQEILKIKQNSLRTNIAYVPQEPLLFHRTLAENIGYSNLEATMEKVIDASKTAHAHEFVKKLPLGYDTLVGERGIKLSGGQRQRVAIARALLKNAPILVLDEATSSLDSESEKFIQKGLWELMKDKTAVVIAHRLSTIKHLDRILVLEDGEIVEDGTHDELLKQNGLYAKLWSHQSGGFLKD